MIEVKVWGEDNLWHAQVLKPQRAAEVAARRADHAVLKALTAYRRTIAGPLLKCDRCGHEWRGRKKASGAAEPKKCPRCNQPPHYSPLVEIGLQEPPTTARRRREAKP